MNNCEKPGYDSDSLGKHFLTLSVFNKLKYKISHIVFSVNNGTIEKKITNNSYFTDENINFNIDFTVCESKKLVGINDSRVFAYDMQGKKYQCEQVLLFDDECKIENHLNFTFEDLDGFGLFIVQSTPEKVSQVENDLHYQTGEQVQEAIQAESGVINERIDSEVEQLETEIQESKITINGSALIDATTENQTVTLTSKTFVFEQGIPSDTWKITHNLDKRPSVELIDSSGKVFLSEVDYIDNNSLIVHINGTISGKAYLN